MARRAKPLLISNAQRQELLKLTRKRTIAAKIFLRARIILMASEGWGHLEISEALGIHRNHVLKWRKRFKEGGISSLEDRARSGKPPTYSEKDRQKIVTMACTKPAKGLSRWSVRTLAKAAKMSENFVHRVLKTHDLHPHRLRTFNFSPDPDFEDKLLEVVALYMEPPDNALVLCMDEKTGIQALDRTQPVLAAQIFWIFDSCA